MVALFDKKCSEYFSDKMFAKRKVILVRLALMNNAISGGMLWNSVWTLSVKYINGWKINRNLAHITVGLKCLNVWPVVSI